MPKKDNSTFARKVSLRQNALAQLPGPVSVLETHGGVGRLYSRCYSHLARGVVFEKDAGKVESLADQRPGWAVYEADARAAIAAGFGLQFRPNLFDLDPYGEPWPVFDAIVARALSWGPGPVVFVVNDGLRQKAQTGAGWHCDSLREAVAEFGNHNLYARYLDVCRWKMANAAQVVGRRLSGWAGYYCGHNQGMTHYAAVMG